MNKGKIVSAGVLTIVALMAVSPISWASAARVVFASGDVWVDPADGDSRKARIGERIEPGDTVITNIGRAQLRFSDGGHVGLIKNSRFRVDKYSYSGRADGSERSFFSLLKGGLRAVTGAIGRINKKRYQVNALVATIGIRGTSYQARLCAGDCIGADGLYVKGGTGTISITNPAGSIDVSAGQAGYIASIDMAPAYSTAEPEVPVTTEGEAEVLAESGEDVVPSSVVEPGTEDSLAGEVFLGGEAVQVVRVIDARSGGLAGASTNIPVARYSSNTHPADALDEDAGSGAGGGVGFVDAGDSITFGLNSDNGVTMIGLSGQDDEDGTTGSGVLTFSNVQDVGTDGTLYWGRWTEGNIHAEASASDGWHGVADLNLTAQESVHYIIGEPAAAIPGAGTATYTFVGGTSSTGNDGSIGLGATSGALVANFGANTVQVQNMVVNHNTIDYTVNSDPLRIDTDGGFEDEPWLPGHDAWATGGGCGGGCDTEIGGFFAGQGPSAPSRAGFGYEIVAPVTSITGVAGFACTMGGC